MYKLDAFKTTCWLAFLLFVAVFWCAVFAVGSRALARGAVIMSTDEYNYRRGFRPRNDDFYFRPDAGVYRLTRPAPPNNCGPHAFEVLNPEPGERRCFGR